MKNIGQLIKKELELNYLLLDIIHDRILWCHLINAANSLSIMLYSYLFFFLSCIAALLGGEVILTDLPDRLRLLRKNIETNMKHISLRGSITATELTWGEDPDPEIIDPTPDYSNNLPSTLSNN